MSRSKSNEPKLKQKGKTGCYFFRRSIGGKDTVISTHTPILSEAKKFRKKYVDAETTAQVMVKQQEAAPKIADIVIKAVKGESIQRFSMKEGFEIYLAHTPDFIDLSEGQKKSIGRTYDNFVKWCAEERIIFMDEVTPSVSQRFAKYLWEQHLAPNTFNNYVKILSKIFDTVDAVKYLPNRNPFNGKIIRRQKVGLVSEASHQPFESYMVEAIMGSATKYGQDWLDLFIVGYQTGMRLRDAALFEWGWIHGDFVEFMPNKTRKYSIVARFPISQALRSLLERRKAQPNMSRYVNPEIAKFMLSGDWVTNRCQNIINEALGKENTQYPKGTHRKKNTCIYSFHSFRTTFMSLLAMKQIPYRDAMVMLGWNNMEMVQVYEKMLQKARGDQDQRNKNLIDSLTELVTPLEGIKASLPRLYPTRPALGFLIDRYSNITIGRIYDISSVAVGHWLKRYGLTRTDRIISDKVTEEEILKVREGLRKAA